MPSTSKKQHNFMEAVANNPKFAKKVGVPQTVGQDFAEADKVKMPKSRPDLQGVNKPKTDHGSMNLYKKGGVMKSDMKEDTKMDKSQDKAMIKKAFKQHDSQEHKGGKGTKLMLKKGGMPAGMKDKAGRAMSSPSPDMMGRAMTKGPMAAEATPTMKKGGMPMVIKGGKKIPAFAAKKGGMTKMAAGGMAKGGGIESKGKTKGKMITMNRGGKTC